MKLLNFRKSGEKSFKCCNQDIVFFDTISCNRSKEVSIMFCKKCNTKFYQEIILGHQFEKKTLKKTGYPHYLTFTLPENFE